LRNYKHAQNPEDQDYDKEIEEGEPFPCKLYAITLLEEVTSNGPPPLWNELPFHRARPF